MMQSNILSRIGIPSQPFFRALRVAGWLAVLSLGLRTAEAASAYAGFYTGFVYVSVSGAVTVPESAAGAAAFTVDSNGGITGNLTGTVNDLGNITWDANATGFTTGTISGGVLAATNSVNNGGAITTTRIAANNNGGGFGGGGTVAQSLMWRRPSPTGANMRGVTFGGGKFVAVGPGGSVGISSDGTNWLAVNANTTRQLNAVAHGNGVYVAVGNGAAVISSPDALTWTARSVTGIQNIVGVAFGNGVFVAVSIQNEIYSSTDGMAWTTVQGPSAAGLSWSNLKFLNGVFVALGNNLFSGAIRIQTSANGSTWNPEQNPGTGTLSDVTYGNGKWVAMNSVTVVSFANANASGAATTAVSGLGDAIGFINGLFVSDNRHYSTDALTWKRDSYPNLDINDFVTANGLMVAVGAAMTTSTDGKLWSVHTKVLPQPTVNNVGFSGVVGGHINDEIEYYNFQGAARYLRLGVGGLIDERPNGSLLYTNVLSPTTNTLRDGFGLKSDGFGSPNGGLAVGDNGTIVRYSTGLNAWTNVPSGSAAHLRSIAGLSLNGPGATILAAVGTGGTILRTTNSGQSWVAASSGTASDLNRVAYLTGTGFNYCIAVGDNGVIRKSTDGITWAPLTSGTTKRLVGIGNRTIGPVKLVAVADDSTVLVSEDHGTNWRSITVNAPLGITYTDGTTAYGVGGFQMTSFNDATNWTYSLPFIGTAGVGHGNGRFVVLAGLQRLASTDLENWYASPVSYNHSSVVFGNGLLVSVGGGGSNGRGFVSTSADGSRWIDRFTPTLIGLNSVTYAQGKFVAVGDSGTILSSTDGINWSNRTPAASGLSLRGVAYGNGQFVAIGQSDILRYSTDGETWITTGTSGTTLNAITFANGLFVAVGDNGAVRSSTNGINWTARTTTPGHNRVLKAVRYAGGRFVAVGNLDNSGDGAVVVHSADGTNWTKEVSNIAFALNAAVAAAGQYVAVGDNGTLVSAPYQDSGAPVITGQPGPANQTVNANATVNYTVTASGAGLQFRWLKDGTPLADGPGISGSATATLSLTGVDVLDVGTYQVSVWNDTSSTLSQPVSLLVNGPPIIVVNPVSVIISNLLTTNFTVTAVGPGPFTYQWRFNNQNLIDGGKFSGTATAKLTITNVAGTNEGAYDVIVSNAYGASAPSNPAQLLVNRPATITQPPQPVFINQGQTATLTVVADGTLPLFYQWKRNGTNLTNGGNVSGATNATLTIQNAQVSDGASYTVTVTNSFPPAANSISAYVSVFGAGALHPQFVLNGGGVTWDIAPAGDGKFLIGGDVGITASGLTWSRLAKIDSNGVPTLTFATTNNAQSANGTIRTIAPQAGGQIVVGGSFAWGGNASYAYAVRLSADGVLDTTYQPAPAQTVKKILPLAGGKVLLGRTLLGFATSRVNRYESTGALDGTFTEVVNLNRELHGLARQSDGTIWMSGLFGLKKSNADGTSPTGVATYAPFPEMFLVHVGPDDKIYYSDNNGQYFGRLNADGARDLSFTNTINGHVFDMAFLPGGRMVIVGDFHIINTITNAYIALLEDNGAVVTSFKSPYTWVFGNSLNAIEMLADGSALVGGTVQMTLPTIQRYLQRVQITAPAATGVTFAQWLTGQGLPIGQDGPNDDPDGDGINNVFEFYFASSPINPASGTKPVLVNVQVTGVDYPAITFIRSKTAAGVTLIPQASSKANFTDAQGTVQHSVVDLGNGTEQVTLRSAVSMAAQASQFLRIQLTVP